MNGRRPQRCEAHAYIREEDVMGQYLAHVRSLQMPESLAKAMATGLREQHGQMEADVRARMTAAHARVYKYGRLIEAAYEDKLEGNITEAFFQEKRTEWERLCREAARDIERLTQVSSKTLDQTIGLIELSRRTHSRLCQREPLEQRDLLPQSEDGGCYRAVSLRDLASRSDDDPNERDPGLGGPGQFSKWSGRQDSNLRPEAPKAPALPG
jgi:hypothetical protein